MKSNTRRLLALATAIMMLAACALTATAESYYNETGLPICDEEITLNMMHINDYTKDSNSTFFINWVRENMGINIVIEAYPQSTIQTQYALRMQDDDLPDLVQFAPSVEEYHDFYLDFKPYMDAGLMPNAVAWFEKHPDAEKLCTFSNGAVYGFGNVRTDDITRLVRFDLINTTWLKNVGKEMPTTLDELTDVLMAFRDMDADGDGDATNEIPMSYTLNTGRTGERLDWTMLSCFGIDTCALEYILQADEDGKVFLAETTENYKAYLTYLNMLFDEGLLDNALYTQTDDEYVEKLRNHSIGVCDFWGVNISYIAATDEEKVQAAKDFAWFAPVMSEYNPDQSLILWNAANGPSPLASANTKYPEAIARFADYWLTEEGAILYNYGVEGETFDWVEGQSGLRIPSHQNYYAEKGYTTANDFTVQYVRPSNFTTWFVYSPVNATMARLIDAGDVEKLNNYLQYPDSLDAAIPALALLEHGTHTAYPTVSYTPDMIDRLANSKVDITNYIKTMKCQFITGELDIETEWDNFITTLESMDLESVMAIEQEAYDNYMGR